MTEFDINIARLVSFSRATQCVGRQCAGTSWDWLQLNWKPLLSRTRPTLLWTGVSKPRWDCYEHWHWPKNYGWLFHILITNQPPIECSEIRPAAGEPCPGHGPGEVCPFQAHTLSVQPQGGWREHGERQVKDLSHFIEIWYLSRPCQHFLQISQDPTVRGPTGTTSGQQRNPGRTHVAAGLENNLL